MGYIPITFDEATKRYPDETVQCMLKKHNSSSKSRDIPIDKCQFMIDWAVFCDRPEPKGNDVEKIVKSNMSCRHIVHLLCKCGRARWSVQIDIDKYGIPPEIEAEYRKFAEENVAEKKRIKGLTKAERDKEIADNLKELSKSPGFYAFHMPH